MVSSDFVHLHLHTQYSLLDGAIRLDDLFAKVKDYGMHSIAITDHGGMFGLVDFYLKAKENGIKPILGCEFYITPGSRFEKDANGKQNTLFHLILLAKDREGYKNLVKLSTASYLEGFYYKPRIDKELLKQHTKGLVALSACLKGEIPSLILRGDMKGARNVALEFKEIFCDGFFLELQHNGMKEQKIVNKGILDLGKELEIPVVATNDCHYLNKNDARAHDVLLCIQTGKTISDENRLRFSTDQLYVRSQEEMASLFSYCPESIKNTLVIAEMCNVELELGVPHFPNFPLPEGETPNRCLERETYEGFKKRVLEGTINGEKEKYEKRLKRELEVIQSTGFASYFLIVSDFARYARVQGIPIGPGRGSVAGSLIAYCLGITNIDPLAYNLLFERFLNPERISLPDIDIDFCIEGRETIIEYLSQKYGKDNVSQIATFGTMQAKLAVRDTGRALNFPTKEVDNIAKMIPNVLNITLETAISQEKSLKELFSSDEKVTKLLTMASRLEGLTRHASTHAAGIVISDKPLVEYLPLFKGTHGEIVSQYHMGSIEKIGLIKFDILGLKTLTVIEDTKKNIKESTGFDIYLDKIDMTDRATFDLLCSGETTGIFQLESSGMRDLIVRLKPESFEDIIALVGLYRPGPLGSGMVDEFIKRKRSKETLTYTIPQLEPILKDTYGVIVYQEQVMQIASTLANFSLGEADMLRRAMGKKKPEEMEMQRDRFISGALENGISLKDAKQLFEQMSMFAGYGFNRSHSAAYAMITYQTAYLKAHYPVELMAALLTSDMNRTDKIMRYISECRETGIEILAPDVNQSFTHFTVSEGKIRFGLAAVKNIGKQAVDSIVLERKQNDAFHSFHDFCCRVNPRNVNKKVLESLIKCGAFDFTQYNRPQLLSIMELEMEHGQKMQRDGKKKQKSMFQSFERNYREEIPDAIDWTYQQFLNGEKESLGFYLSGHPLSSISKKIKRVASDDTKSLPEKKNHSEVTIVGMVNGFQEKSTKRNTTMARFTLEDMKGVVEVIVFPDVLSKYYEVLRSEAPVFVKGIIDNVEDVIKIKASEILPFKDIEREKINALYIKTRSNTLDDDYIYGLRDICVRNQGNCIIYFYVELDDKTEVTLRAGGDYCISLDEETLKEIADVVGEESVYF